MLVLRRRTRNLNPARFSVRPTRRLIAPATMFLLGRWRVLKQIATAPSARSFLSCRAFKPPHCSKERSPSYPRCPYLREFELQPDGSLPARPLFHLVPLLRTRPLRQAPRYAESGCYPAGLDKRSPI